MARRTSFPSFSLQRTGGVFLLFLVACNLQGRGDTPVKGEINYPTGLQLSSDGDRLFVVNSNFDRRYRSGSVQAYDLSKLSAALKSKCLAKSPGIECELDGPDVLQSEVLINSLARAVTLSSDGERLLVPTHADGSLSWVETNKGASNSLSCGGSRTCSDAYKTGDDETANGQRMPYDTIGLASVALRELPGGDGEAPPGLDATVAVHRNGEVSLFVDEADGDGARPVLQHVVRISTGALTGIAYDPDSGLFNITTKINTSGSKFLLRVGIEVLTGGGHSLFVAESVVLYGLRAGQDTWGVTFPEAERGGNPWVLAQRPDALLEISMAPDGLTANIQRIVELSAGASRLEVADVTLGGTTRHLAVVSCLSQRKVYIVDTDWGDVVSIIPGFSGPTEMAVDGKRGLLFVADFRSSTVRVVDLNPLENRESARIVGTLGHPQFLEELN